MFSTGRVETLMLLPFMVDFFNRTRQKKIVPTKGLGIIFNNTLEFILVLGFLILNVYCSMIWVPSVDLSKSEQFTLKLDEEIAQDFGASF